MPEFSDSGTFWQSPMWRRIPSNISISRIKKNNKGFLETLAFGISMASGPAVLNIFRGLFSGQSFRKVVFGKTIRNKKKVITHSLNARIL